MNGDRLGDHVDEWGTTADPAWLWLQDRVRLLEPVKDLRDATQDCQIAVGRLADQARHPGPIGDAASRALHSLALDIHHECRRLRAGKDASQAGTDRAHPSLLCWVWSPIGSGDPTTGNLQAMRRTHRLTCILRLVGALLAALSLAAGHPAFALLALVGSVSISGLTRFRTNAEAASTFRARYFSSMLGQFGDVAVLVGGATWLVRAGHHWLAVFPLLTCFVLMAGEIIRAGALQVGAYVPRLRSDRIVRVGLLSIAVFFAALDQPGLGFGIAFTIAAVQMFVDAAHVFDRVWDAGATEFAWTALTEKGFTSEVLTAPHPNDGTNARVDTQALDMS